MTILLLTLWLSWRYRVRPKTGDQHSQGSGHDVIIWEYPHWACLDCTRTYDNTIFTLPEVLRTVVIVACALVISYVGFRIGGWLL